MENTRLNKRFGLTMAGVALLVFTYQLYFKHHALIYLAGAAFIVGLIALISPWLLNPFRIIWDKIGLILGAVNTCLLLCIVFFLMVVPLGYILKLMNKNLIDRKWLKGNQSYWQPVNGDPNQSLKQQF